MKKFVILFAVLFSVHLSSAQEKYSYLQVSYNAHAGYINISDGAEYKAEKLEKKSGEFNANPLIRKISELEDQGWELTGREMVAISVGQSFNTVYGHYIMNAYMRKKR